MIRTFGRRAVDYADVGVALALGLALTVGVAHGFTAPKGGDLGYDIYDIVVNKGVKGPLGFVAGVAAFLFGVIRAALVTDGTLGKDAMVASVLESRDLTRPQARLATSYRPGDIVTFRKSEKGRPRAGIGHRVEAVDPATGTVRLLPDKRPRQRAESKPVDWQPARWGADVAEAFTEVAQEFRTGDRVQFTRNNYRVDRLNGQTAEVIAIAPAGSSLVLQGEDGRREMLDLNHLADRHIRPGWVRTIHSAQGATCDRVLAHLEAFRANTVDARSVYVAISRAREGAAVYTDSRASLTEALGLRDGAQVGAIDEALTREQPSLMI